jgi:hypothetical protein
MDFKDALTSLGQKSAKYSDQLKNSTEEATKTALIIPFIQLLGYDVSNPFEVVPEYGAELGQYKDQRVDYGILKDGKAIIIIECKKYGEPLDAKKSAQLLAYFQGASVKVAVLTDGRYYQFYSDLDTPNKMDTSPYMVLDIEKLDESLIPELAKLCKENFDIEKAVSSAEELKYNRAFKAIMAEQLKSPDGDFLRLFMKKASDRVITQKVIDKYTPVLKKALTQFIQDRVNDRLAMAQQLDETDPEKQPNKANEDVSNNPESENGNNSKIETTEDELQGYYIVKSILGAKFGVDNIQYKDYQGFFTVFYKRVGHKICKFYFNKEPYMVEIFDSESSDRVKIDKLEDLYGLSDRLINATNSFAQE